jgi:hypothetical protein
LARHWLGIYLILPVMFPTVFCTTASWRVMLLPFCCR